MRETLIIFMSLTKDLKLKRDLIPSNDDDNDDDPISSFLVSGGENLTMRLDEKYESVFHFTSIVVIIFIFIGFSPFLFFQSAETFNFRSKLSKRRRCLFRVSSSTFWLL